MYLTVWKIKLKAQNFDILEKKAFSLAFLSFVKRIAFVCSYTPFYKRENNAVPIKNRECRSRSS